MKTELLAWLINATVATSLASIAVQLLRKLLQRWLGAEIAYRLWVVVPLAAIVALFSPPQFTSASTPIVGTSFSMAPAIQVYTQRAWIASNADLWLLGAWATGLFALIALLVWQQRRFIARMRLQPRADGSWRSGSVDAAPALLGLLRPRLVLPEAFEADYSADEQRLVIAHERTHQQRRDPWALAMCAVLRVLFWFNPLLHFAAGCFRRDMEFACDAAVLRLYPDKRRLYASALLKTQLAGSALPVGCLWHHMPPMKERLMLLKLAKPIRRHAWIGIALIVSAAAAVSGVALAGHDAAAKAADALAAPTPASHAPPPYMVKLAMSVDGKIVANPAVITRPGETAMIKIDENGVAWGLKFQVDDKPGSKVALTGDLFTISEQNVIGHARLEETAGTPLVIAMKDKAGVHSYRIEARIAIAPPQPPRAGRRMRVESDANAMTAPGERRDIEIVRNGTPGPDDEADAEDAQDELMPGDTPPPGARIEVQREITMPKHPGLAANDKSRTVRTERKVIISRNADGTTPPLPPLPPNPDTPPPPPPPPMGMRAPLAPPSPPAPPAMRAPPPPPAPPIPPEPSGAAQTAPTYPPAALAKGIGGEVRLKVLVGADGSAKHVEVVSSHPTGVFDQASVDAAKKWHFHPPVDAKGRPVSGYVMVPVTFVPDHRSTQ